MSIQERIVDGLNRVAAGTSRRRVKREEDVRLAHHDGPAHELYERAKPFADEVDRIAMQVEGDL